MREYTLRFLEDNDWVRITAVYNNIEDVSIHASDLLIQGHVVQMLVRDNRVSIFWSTIKLGSEGQILLGRKVTSIPA